MSGKKSMIAIALLLAICKGMNKYEFIMKYAAQNQRMHLVFYFLHPLKFQTIRIQQRISL